MVDQKDNQSPKSRFDGLSHEICDIIRSKEFHTVDFPQEDKKDRPLVARE